MVNPWAWNGRNPYEETAFQVLDVDPAADRATLRGRVAARRKRISYDAARFPLFGRVLSVAEVNAAEEQLADPAARLAAELLTHHPEPGGDDLALPAELLDLAESLSATGGEPPDPGELELNLPALTTLLPPPLWEADAHLDEETDG